MSAKDWVKRLMLYVEAQDVELMTAMFEKAVRAIRSEQMSACVNIFREYVALKDGQTVAGVAADIYMYAALD